MAPGCPIDVVVAVEIPPVSVPDFKGMSLTDVQRQLQRTGLTPGSLSYKQGDAAPGTVIAQDPAPGTVVKAGTRLNLVVTPQRQTPPPPPQPDDLVNVPDMKGMMRGDALARLRQLGMKVNVEFKDLTPSVRTSRIGPKHDQVISQSPVGQVRRGTTITLTVARVQQPIGD